MKRLFYIAFPLLAACGSDDEFSCDKNARFTYNGGTECAHASIESYSKDTVNGDESFLIALTSTFTNFKLNVGDDAELVTDKEYTYPDNVFIIGPGHSQTFSIKVTLTKLDRNARIISGVFNFETERDVNSAGVPFNSEGAFTDVAF